MPDYSIGEAAGLLGVIFNDGINHIPRATRLRCERCFHLELNLSS